MQESFYQLADHLTEQLTGDEIFTAWLAAEESDFVRMNHAQIRQPGNVSQAVLSLRLILGRRHATIELSLSGDGTQDIRLATDALGRLREQLPHLPEDPLLLFNQEPSSGEFIDPTPAPKAPEIIDRVLGAAQGLDFVGIYAGGTMYRGFASSLGQRNWFAKPSFNLDWSLYAHTDKAVKCNYADFQWDDDRFTRKLAVAREQLAVLERPAKTLDPGEYRVFLAPAAMDEILALLAWGGFGVRSHRTKQTPLLRLIEGESALSPRVNWYEDIGGGASPAFQEDGFIKPERVELVTGGRSAGALVGPRSAQEYDVPANGASQTETPMALAMDGGDLVEADMLGRLGTGLLVNNLWYLNYSDQAAGRITGMTRFATLWVEDGAIVAPTNVMRFDDTLYRMLGSELEDLTRERDLNLDPDTYFARSTGCRRVPGALLRSLKLTL